MNEMKMNSDLLNYLMSELQMMVECDIEEKINCFPYTIAFNQFVQKLKLDYGIEFNKELISEKLLAKMVEEIICSLPK